MDDKEALSGAILGSRLGDGAWIDQRHLRVDLATTHLDEWQMEKQVEHLFALVSYKLFIIASSPIVILHGQLSQLAGVGSHILLLV